MLRLEVVAEVCLLNDLALDMLDLLFAWIYDV